MTWISKDVPIQKLHDAVHGYNNTYNRTIKMKPIGVNSTTYIALLLKKL